jgi:hypothetical protein
VRSLGLTDHSVGENGLYPRVKNVTRPAIRNGVVFLKPLVQEADLLVTEMPIRKKASGYSYEAAKGSLELVGVPNCLAGKVVSHDSRSANTVPAQKIRL